MVLTSGRDDPAVRHVTCDAAAREWDGTADVLVVGAGGCGLVAALAAAEAGADVAVVEKLERLAGNTMLSSGSIPAAGTRFQRAAGIDDSPARFAADLKRVSGPHEAEHLADRLAAISAPMVEWLVDVVGVDLRLITEYRHVGHSVNRLHAPPSRRGGDLMNDLWKAAEARGIPVAFASPAIELVAADDGTIIGAVTAGARSEPARIGASAVVLACNGFGNNRDLLRRFCPAIADAPYFGALGSEGEAVRWGEQHGARLANMGSYQAHAGIAQPHGALVTWTVVEKGGVIVNGAGARFADETLGYSAFAAHALRQTGPIYAIYDSRIRDATAAGQEEFAELRAHGGCIEAPGVADLAAICSIERNALEEMLARAAQAARGEVADAFGRKAWGIGPLTPPYVATRIAPALFHTQGGLAVDADARVLRSDGRPIQGLYAGGGAASGISGAQGSLGYSSGNGLLAALGLGFIAGRAAAAHAAAQRRQTRTAAD